MAKRTQSIKKALDILKALLLKSELRMAISGGFSIDAYISKLTRNHNDLDIDAYGHTPQKKGIKTVGMAINRFRPKFNGIYYTLNVGKIKVDIGYVSVVKEDGRRKNFIYDAGSGEFKINSLLF